MLENIAIDCGWGKLILGESFSSVDKLASELKKERKKERNICFNSPDSQVLLHQYSQNFFINPAYTYALDIENFSIRRSKRKSFSLRAVQSENDITELNKVYSKLGMQEFRANWWSEKKPESLSLFVAVDSQSQKIIGGIMLVDHFVAIKNSHKTASIWSVAVDPDCHIAGVGKSLIKYVIQECKKKKRKKLFLSVIHSNMPAQKLYESLGFERCNIFTIKNKSKINQKYFISENFLKKFPLKIRGVITEALTRGIQVKDMFSHFFQLSFGGRNITCNDSLTELTNSINASYCANQKMFFHILEENNFSFPATLFTSKFSKGVEFLKKHQSVIMKSQLHKLSSDEIKTPVMLRKMGTKISKPSEEVILQKFEKGESYRILIIDFKVIGVMKAQAPSITGDGTHSIRNLIKKLARKKLAMTEGESKITLDSSTRSTVSKYGYTLDDILPAGEKICIRKNFTFQSGGNMKDVSEDFPMFFKKIAISLAKKLSLSVLDIEMIIPDLEDEKYFILGGNPKPNFLYYKGRQAETKFLDFLFPQTKK
jgi:GNAT-family acetyltransferase (TIGR03103 family)